jgi:transposase
LGQARQPDTHEAEGLKFAVHVWGAIWNDGALFQQYRGWLTADRYTEILKHNILANKRRFRGKTILHDGAPSHRAKLTQEWLNENQLAVEFTPPHSPQFNAIEYAWAWLKSQVRDTEPHSDADLKESMKLACQLLPAKVRQNYSNNPKNRHFFVRCSCVKAVFAHLDRGQFEE